MVPLKKAFLPQNCADMPHLPKKVRFCRNFEIIMRFCRNFEIKNAFLPLNRRFWRKIGTKTLFNIFSHPIEELCMYLNSSPSRVSKFQHSGHNPRVGDQGEGKLYLLESTPGVSFCKYASKGPMRPK